MDMIQTLEREEIARLNRTIPAFAPGDTVIVSVNVVEGTRKRVQAFEGVVIAKRNRSLNSSFIVRKVSSGEGVERTFQTYSPLIASIEVKRRGDVRRAKLYYLRDRVGRGARVRERRFSAADAAREEPLVPETAPADGEGVMPPPDTDVVEQTPDEAEAEEAATTEGSDEEQEPAAEADSDDAPESEADRGA